MLIILPIILLIIMVITIILTTIMISLNIMNIVLTMTMTRGASGPCRWISGQQIGPISVAGYPHKPSHPPDRGYQKRDALMDQTAAAAG